MVNFNLIDDSQDLKVELLDDNEEINFSMTDYDDTEVKRQIQELDNKKADKTQVNELSNQVSANTAQIAQNKADIEVLDNRVDQIPIVTKTSQLTNDSGFITSDYHDDTKQDKLISGQNIKTINNESVLGSGNINIEGVTNYEELNNLPKVNNVELKGNKSLNDLGIQPEGNYALSSDIPTRLSQLIEDNTHRVVTDIEKTTWNSKQNEITSSNKLASDLVDDTNQTNKFVTTTEKQTWNNKSNFSGSANDLTDKPTITYVEGVPNSSKVVELTNVTETIVGNKNIEDYGVPKFMPIDLSIYDTNKRNKQLKPYTQLPDGNYIVTSKGNIYFDGAGSYFAEEGTFIFKFDGYEVTLIGPDGPALYLYDEDSNEWSGGGFTTSDDVDTAIEMAMPLISNYKNVGVKTPDDFDTGLHIIDMSSGAMLPLTLSLNVEGTTQTYTNIENGTLIIKTKNNNFHVIGTEALFFEYDSTNSYYKKPVNLFNFDFVNKEDMQKSLINTNSPMPNFDDMEVLETYEFDIADTNYHPIYTLPNTGLDYTGTNIVVGYRLTVTGQGINQVADIIDTWHNPVSYPLTTALNRTLSTSGATTGVRYLRAVYPVAAHLNDTTYPLGQEIAAYNATARHIKVEVFKQPTDITWKSASESSIYVSSTYNGNSSLTLYTTRGWIFRSPQSFAASSASSATYSSGYDTATIGSSAIKTGASAISANHLAYLADDGLVYDISNTTKNISSEYKKIGLVSNALSKNTAITYNYFRVASQLSSTTLGTISHATLALGRRVFLRCTMDASGNIHSDNYLDTVMSAGYTWLPIGVATASNAVNMDTRGQNFYTLDANGKLTHIDGLEIA